MRFLITFDQGLLLRPAKTGKVSDKYDNPSKIPLSRKLFLQLQSIETTQIHIIVIVPIKILLEIFLLTST